MDDDRGLTRRQVVQYGGAAVAAGALLGAAGAQAATTARGIVDLNQPAAPFPHVWERVVGGDWAKQALRRDYQDQLLEAHRDLGVESLRFHGVLNTEMSVYAPSAGLPRPAPFTQDPYSFFNVDQIYDFLVDHGMHPFVELSSMPEALQARPPSFRVFLYRFNPAEPADYGAWGRLVGAFAKHLVDRYGIREVRTWPFEVWNEPNLPFFFEGDQQAYFKLYRAAAEAIKGVDASLQVGGPATSAGQLSLGAPRSPGPRYLREFMEYVTANDVPIDFGSAHGYDTDTGAGPEGAATFFKRNRADTPARLPLYISETNITARLGDLSTDKSDAAAGFLRTVIETAGVVDALGYWAFSDIFEEVTQPDNPFSGSFGLQTIHGIKKPAYRLLEVLHEVGTTRLPLTVTGASAGVGGIVVTGGRRGGLDVLLFNHSVPSGTEGVPPTPAQPARLTIVLRGLPAEGARARIRRIDADHANPYRRWVELGSPEYPSRRQLRSIAEASELEAERLDLQRDPASGDAAFTLTLPAEAVAAVHVR